MRTRTLLLAAALSAAGLATSMAQSNVYSLNIVGYVNKVIPQAGKYALLANPLDNSSNTLSVLFPGVPVGTTVIPLTPGGFTQTYTHLGSGNWVPANIAIPVGKGAFARSPALSVVDITNTFVGEVKSGPQTNSLPAGYSIAGSIFPADGDATTLGLTAVLTPGANTQIIGYQAGLGYAPTKTLVAPNTWAPSVPTILVGDGFIVRTPSAVNWGQNFTP